MERRHFLKSAGLGVAAGTTLLAAQVQARETAAPKKNAPWLAARTEAQIAKLERVKVDLVAPPMVHKHERKWVPSLAWWNSA
jgi:nitrite reductase (NO-forming)